MTKILYFITDMDQIGIQLGLGQKDMEEDVEIGICLLQDAVYFGCDGRKGMGTVTEAIKRGIQVFAAKRDVELRGLTQLLNKKIRVLDYTEIIDLIFNYEKIVNI